MEKITIKGFGPIQDAEIEVKKLLVLIGEQASGKSTIAKLIYFFKSLPDEILKAYLSSDQEQLQLESFVKDTVYELFLDRFGYLISSKSFTIKYLNTFTTEFSISIGRKDGNDLGAEISSALNAKLQARSFFFDNLRASLRNLEQIKDEASDFQQRNDAKLIHEREIKRFKREFDAIFEQVASDKFFIIAGRESIESYPEVFGRYSQMNHEEGIGTSIWSKETFDEKLLKGFLDQVRFHRKSFLKNHETFNGILKRMQMVDRLGSVASVSSRNYGDDLLLRVQGILKAEYEVQEDSEFLVSTDGSKTLLSSASSGQKESIRMIQDLLMAVGNLGSAFFRVIEEPEAHLFPVAQKQLIELLVFLANAQPENQVIITTHSPYVLTTLNNLLFATRVVAKNPNAEAEVAEVAPIAFRIDPATFAAYSLGNSFDTSLPYCASIVDPEMGMIDQNYLDSVSDLLGMEFDHLRNIHIRSFQRHGGQ